MARVEHRCSFDSQEGVGYTAHGPALLCRCGTFGATLGGTWHGLPEALTNRSCRRIRLMRKLERNLGWIAGFLAALVLLAMVLL